MRSTHICESAKDEGIGPLVAGSKDDFMTVLRSTLKVGMAHSTSEIVDGPERLWLRSWIRFAGGSLRSISSDRGHG